MPTHCCISDAESVNYSRLPQLPKAVWVFLCVYTSFIHFRRNNLHRTSCSKRTRHTQGTKLFIVVVFAYKGTTNHLGALSEKGQSKAWITHEVTVPCSPPSPLHRWLSQEAPPDDLFATTHLSHFNKPTEVELSYKSQHQSSFSPQLTKTRVFCTIEINNRWENGNTTHTEQGKGTDLFTPRSDRDGCQCYWAFKASASVTHQIIQECLFILPFYHLLELLLLLHEQAPLLALLPLHLQSLLQLLLLPRLTGKPEIRNQLPATPQPPKDPSQARPGESSQILPFKAEF